MKPFVKLKRTEKANDLLELHPNAFLLLTLIALRARREPNLIRGLDICECHLGDYEACGLTRQKYRTAVNVLETLGLASFYKTNKGTTGKLLNTDIYDINACAVNQQDNQQGNQPDNQQATTNKNVKKGKNVKEIPHPENAEQFYITKKKKKLSGKRLESFNRFWSCFNHKKDKANAADSWLDIPSLTDTLVNDICNAAEQEAKRRPVLIEKGSTPKWAQGWLTSKRWEDEIVDTPLNQLSEYEQTLADGRIL